MTNIEIIILSLSISFCATQIWKPINKKPFNCMMCFTGWCAMLIAAFCLYWYAPLLFPVGCFIGAIVDAAMNKYL